MASESHDIFCPSYTTEFVFSGVSGLECVICQEIQKIREDERERQFNANRSQTCYRCN